MATRGRRAPVSCVSGSCDLHPVPSPGGRAALRVQTPRLLGLHLPQESLELRRRLPVSSTLGGCFQGGPSPRGWPRAPSPHPLGDLSWSGTSQPPTSRGAALTAQGPQVLRTLPDSQGPGHHSALSCGPFRPRSSGTGAPDLPDPPASHPGVGEAPSCWSSQGARPPGGELPGSRGLRLPAGSPGPVRFPPAPQCWSFRYL